jgi:hypothetical protein
LRGLTRKDSSDFLEVELQRRLCGLRQRNNPRRTAFAVLDSKRRVVEARRTPVE